MSSLPRRRPGIDGRRAAGSARTTWRRVADHGRTPSGEGRRPRKQQPSLRDTVATRTDLLFEIAALRQQLEVYQRQVRRPRLQRADRIFWIWLRRHWSRWKSALVIAKPDTDLRWHREGYRRYWPFRSKGKPGRPKIPRKNIAFIRRMSTDNPEWGEDRIALEMKLKLGISHSTSTIRRYMVDSPRPSQSSWRRFLKSHAHEIFELDFTSPIA